MIAPTLLVGLGGIGTQIVNTVYGMIPEDVRKNIAVHGFDTDVNDISKKEHLKGHITQTSDVLTVKQCYQLVLKGGGAVDDWFIDPIPVDLQRKPLTEGAGQIRLTSRLAYFYSMQKGRMSGLEKQVNQLFRVSGGELHGSPRVVIVSSLMGGTGSGIFIQTALYLRELLASHFRDSGAPIIIRGMFMLPDVLINTGCLREKEHERVRANAYACLKEVDAIMKNASASEPAGVTIELEYQPTQIDYRGEKNLALTTDHLPYDMCFLYDFSNDASQNLGDIENYISQMVDSLFLQLFTPIKEKTRSIEDNMIMDLIEGSSAIRYCGAGIARLIYPFEEIVEYCSYRWIGDMLAGEWLKIDDEYERELQQYSRDIEAGIVRTRPERGKRYIGLLDSYASEEGGPSFFIQTYRETHLFDDKGREIESKVQQFIRAVEEKVADVVKNNKDLNETINACHLNEGKLKEIDHAKKEVQRMEDNLEQLQQEVKTFVHEQKNYLVNLVVGESCHVENCIAGNEEYRLTTPFLRKPGPVHPVAVRYMLYEIRETLLQSLKSLELETSKLATAIKNYEKKYDLDRGPDDQHIESAPERLKIAKGQSFIGKLIRSEFKLFIELYQDGSQVQLRNLRTSAQKDLLFEVFSGLLHAVQSLIKEWENYFVNLKEKRFEVVEQIELLGKNHEGHKDSTKSYLAATESDKNSLWESVRLSLVGENNLPTEISEKISIGRYKGFCKRHFPWGEEERWADADSIETDILPWCREKISANSRVNMNVMRVLKKTMDNETAKMSSQIRAVDSCAQPFIPQPADSQNNIALWGIHPDSVEELTEAQNAELFGESSRMIKNEAFSKYEVIRYRSVYGLKAEDLPKFKVGKNGSQDGVYFNAYKNVIAKLNNDPHRFITPHLDRDWHKPAYMPDLNADLAMQEKHNIDKAFIQGLIYGELSCVSTDNREYWNYSGGVAGLKNLFIRSRRVSGGYLNLYEAIGHNPKAVDTVLEYAAKQLEKNKGLYRDDVANYDFVKGLLTLQEPVGKCRNMLDVILSFHVERPSENLSDKVDVVLKSLLNEVFTFCIEIYGSHRLNTAFDSAKEYIEQLQAESVFFMEVGKDKRSQQYRSWANQITLFYQSVEEKIRNQG